MILQYYCEKCCKELGKNFSADAENFIGRKNCSHCGSNKDEYLKTELESEIDY